MATVAATSVMRNSRPDVLSGTPRAHSIDRWIYVAMSAWFIAIVLIGFVPDSVGRVAAIEAGKRHPFPLVTHVHAVVMGAFLLLLLLQTFLVAKGQCGYHRRLGVAGLVLAPALVIVGFILAPTNYHLIWEAAQNGPLPVRETMVRRLPELDNVLLNQMRVGVLFTLFITIGLRARAGNAGLHKRMMILGTAVALPPAFARMTWLPTTMPGSPLAQDLYVLLAVSPMFAWDVIRNRSVHRAYWVWLAGLLAVSAIVHLLWDTPWWHATARQMMDV